jgi:hypothetical protein
VKAGFFFIANASVTVPRRTIPKIRTRRAGRSQGWSGGWLPCILTIAVYDSLHRWPQGSPCESGANDRGWPLRQPSPKNSFWIRQHRHRRRAADRDSARYRVYSPSHPRASKHHMRPNHPGNACPAQLPDVVSHPRDGARNTKKINTKKDDITSIMLSRDAVAEQWMPAGAS